MELDSLKELWREQDELVVTRSSEEDIASMLRKRSQNPIARIKRNLTWELSIILVLYSISMWYYVVAWQGQYWEISILLGLVGAFFVVYYLKKNRLLKDMQRVDHEVKSNLEQRLHTLEKYTRFYAVSGTVLTPAAYFVAGLIILFKSPADQTDDRIPTTVTHIVGHDYFMLFTVSGVAVAIGGYFINTWYVNRLYGRHIQKLKNLLTQMEETD